MGLEFGLTGNSSFSFQKSGFYCGVYGIKKGAKTPFLNRFKTESLWFDPDFLSVVKGF
jgi:hypothetical protein